MPITRVRGPRTVELLTDDVSCDISCIGGKPLAADALFGCFLPRLGPLVATPAASFTSGLFNVLLAYSPPFCLHAQTRFPPG
jgi:hypothetical protein